jgi:hypothetical protein
MLEDFAKPVELAAAAADFLDIAARKIAEGAEAKTEKRRDQQRPARDPE